MHPNLCLPLILWEISIYKADIISCSTLGKLKLLKISERHNLTGGLKWTILARKSDLFVLDPSFNHFYPDNQTNQSNIKRLLVCLSTAFADESPAQFIQFPKTHAVPRNSGINCAVIALQRLHLDIVFRFFWEKTHQLLKAWRPLQIISYFWDHSVNHLCIYLWCSQWQVIRDHVREEFSVCACVFTGVPA